MDFMVIHWAAQSRLFPSAFAVQTVGHLPRKYDWVRHTFTTCNFSFVLEGQGEYYHAGRCWPVQAPCVLAQWPGVRLVYGPTPGIGRVVKKRDAPWWRELYLMFQPALATSLERMGFIDYERPVWRINNAERVYEYANRLLELRGDDYGAADRADRLCEALILESLLGQKGIAPEGAQLRIAKIRQAVTADLTRVPDWDELAAAHGFSPITFRRQWVRWVGMPPGRFLAQLRLREACRLLVETTWPIARIAALCGFEDALYFSRKFSTHTGCSPRDYRARNRPPG